MDPDTLRKTLELKREHKHKHSGEEHEIQEEKPHAHSMPPSPTPKSHNNPQVIIQWEAPIRAYKRKSKGVMKFYLAVSVLLTIIAIFLNVYGVIVPIWAVMFLVYVFTVTAPLTTTNAITVFGLQSGNRTYPWDYLSHFYFIKKFDYHVLVVVTKEAYAHPLYMVIPSNETKQEVLDELSLRLIYQDTPHKTVTDKAAEWLTSLMPEDGDPIVV